MTGKVAFVFPGQGSQEVGMGQALAQQSQAARDVFARADEVLGFKLGKLCFEGPEAELNDTINTQVAIYATSVAALEAVREAGYKVKPAFVAGHSFGEYSAYVAAGVLAFEDGLRLVQERGRLMKLAGETEPGGMAAILRLEDQVVAEICQTVSAEEKYGTLQVACYNSAGQVVISGHSEAVDRGIVLAQAAKARKAVRLPVSIAAHSELMRHIAFQFRAAIDNTPINLPETAIVANITARPLTSIGEIRQEMEAQLTSSVRWLDTVEWIGAQGVSTFVEIGPKNVLTALIKRILDDVTTYTVSTPAELAELLADQV